MQNLNLQAGVVADGMLYLGMLLGADGVRLDELLLAEKRRRPLTHRRAAAEQDSPAVRLPAI